LQVQQLGELGRRRRRARRPGLGRLASHVGPGYNKGWSLKQIQFSYGSGATTAASDSGIFLGTTFGDPVNTTPFTHQESRALGFLH